MIKLPFTVDISEQSTNTRKTFIKLLYGHFGENWFEKFKNLTYNADSSYVYLQVSESNLTTYYTDNIAKNHYEFNHILELLVDNKFNKEMTLSDLIQMI